MFQSQSVEHIAAASQRNFKSTGNSRLPDPFSLLSDEVLKAELLADRGVHDAFPPTALQEGILASTIQGSPHYLDQRIFDVRHLDLVRLRLAFQVVFWRIETLRSTFITSTKGFVQVVRDDFMLLWAETSTSLQDYLEADLEQGITLGDPFIRVAVLDGCTLVVSVHHALFDFWSHGFVFDDVASLYYGRMPTERVPWASFAGLLQDQRQKGSDQFWKQHLAEATPTILNHSPVLESSTVTMVLPIDLKSATVVLETPSSAILYAAWALVLSSHTASKAVTMATAISGRELPLQGIENLDGPTLAVVPQMVSVDPNQSLLQLMKSVNSDLWDIIKHSQQGIQGALAASGHQNVALFDTMLNIQVRGQAGNDITPEVFQTFGGRPAWKTEYVTLNIQEAGEGLELTKWFILPYADGQQQVVIKLDHGLYDGTLLRVFDSHFQAYQMQEALPSFTSFKDFAFHIWEINKTRPTLDFWMHPDKRPIRFQYPHQAQPRITSSVIHTIHLDFDSFSRCSGTTVPIIFQAVFQIWLALRSGQRDVAFDYLYTGRNVDLPDPQTINGTYANFLPMRSHVYEQTPMERFLLGTQDAFWQYTENSIVGLEDIWRACGVTREETANQVLFLFQPFEPASIQASTEQYQKWVVMAKSEVTMPQPYAVVFEVIKTTNPNEYKLRFSYDRSVWAKREVEDEIRIFGQMLSRVIEQPGILVGEILHIA